MSLKLVTPAKQPAMDADQIKDAIDDRNTDMARLQTDVRQFILRHGKSRVINAFLDAWRLADSEGAKW